MTLSARTRASQRSALIHDALADPELSRAAYPISFATFAAACKRLQSTAATLPITCVEIYKMTWSSISVLQTTTGFLGHQYVVATVQLPDGRNTYAKADYLVEDSPTAGSKLILRFNDDHNAFTTDSHLVSRIASSKASGDDNPIGTTVPSGPSLADFASLLAVADARLGARPYAVLGRNCLLMTDTLFYALARRYTAHWLAGSLAPDAPLRRYLYGAAGALETAVACTMSGGWARRWGWWTAYALRAMCVLATWSETGADRYMMHDEEVADWMREWDEYEGRGTAAT